MFTEQIEKLKDEYTDKFVVVDATRPELARFRDVVGRVKTVNMSGRALVEFDEYHQNIGWFDIDLDFLKVVDQPPPKAPKAEAKKATPKPTAKAPTGEPASAGGATTKPKPAPAAKGKGSVADILAAARSGKAAAPAAPKSGAPSSGEPASAGGKPTPTPKAAPIAAPAKIDRSKMSVADMLAAARAGGSAGPAAAPPKAAEPAPVEEAEPQAPPPAPAKKPTPGAPASAGGKKSERIDKSKMSIDDMVAWCRQHDSK